MGFFNRFRTEKSLEQRNGTISVSDPRIAELFGGILGGVSSSGVTVNIENALGVPAVWAAVNFMSGTLAGLPLNVYRKQGDVRVKVTTGIAKILHDAVNDSTSSFEWRKYSFDQVFTGGRSFTYIERNAAGKVVNLIALNPAQMTVKRNGLVESYELKLNDGKTVTYSSNQIIDIPFMLKADGTTHRSPIMSNKDTIGLAIAANEYGSRFFQNGGVPPFVVTGAFQSPGALARGGDDMNEAIKKAAAQKRQALVMPSGLEVNSLGLDPDKMQLVELQKFSVEQISRIYSIPPTFLQDLSKGTFANTEQQDLHFMKHTMRRWVEQFEQELNLKLFGRGNNRIYAELNIDGLLRGDFKTRMDGYSKAVQNGIMKPNEVRRKENMPDDPDGDNLMIQGATVPISNQLNLPLETPQEGEQ